MRKIFTLNALFFLFTIALSAQDYSEDLRDCNLEKDRVYIDWNDQTNSRYVEKRAVEGLSQRKLRQFYCQNLVAKDRLESEGYVISEGSFRLADEDEKYLIFSVRMGDLIYQDKLYIHIGPRQKLALK